MDRPKSTLDGDETDERARDLVDLLDGIPGLFERAQHGLKQAAAGETISLDEL